MAASTESAPVQIACTASEMGISSACLRASETTAEAVAIPSETERRPARISASDLPSPNAWPRLMLRDCGLDAVSSKSPKPDSPCNVAGLAPRAAPKRRNSAKPRVTSAAWAFSSLLAGLAGVLVAPTLVTVDPTSYWVLFIGGLTAAVIGGFARFGWVLGGAIGLTVAIAVLDGYLPQGTFFETVIGPGVPFVLLAALISFHPGMKALQLKSMSGEARFEHQRSEWEINGASRSSIATISARYSPMNTGIWMKIGRQPASGL